MSTERQTIPHRHSFADVVTQYVFKLLALEILIHFFWTVTGYFIEFLPRLSAWPEHDRFTYASVLAAVIAWMWEDRALRRIDRAQPSSFRDHTALGFFGFEHNFSAMRWLAPMSALALGDAIFAAEWHVAALAGFVLLGMISTRLSSAPTESRRDAR